MEITKRALTAVLIAVACGCVIGGKPPKLSSVPPAPQPLPPKAAVVAITPEPPLSYPQTVVKLPRPQAIPPDSILEPPPEEPPTVRTSRGRLPVAASAKEAPAAAETRTPEPIRPAGPAAEETPASALVRTDENAHPRQQIETRVQSVKEILVRVGDRKHTPDLDASIARVRSLLSLAERALKRRDPVQADSLIERAEVIARDMLRAP